MPPPTPPPGFQIQTSASPRPPAPPPGFELSRPRPSAPPAPPPGFEIVELEPPDDGQLTDTLTGAAPAPPPGFELITGAQGPEFVGPRAPIPVEPPIGFGEVLLDSLGQTAGEWGDVFAGLPEKLSASAANTIASVRAMSAGGRALYAQEELTKEPHPFTTMMRARMTPEELAAVQAREAASTARLTDFRDRELERLERELAVAREAGADLVPTEGATLAQRGLEQATASAIPSALALAAGVVTKNPAIAASTMAPTTAAQSFADLLDVYDAEAAQREAETLAPQTEAQRFGDIERAMRYGGREGLIEFGTEVLPFGKVLKAGTPAVQRLAEVLLAELPGETMATLLQAINQQLATQPEGEAPLDAVFAGLEEGGKQIPETLVATILGSAGQTAPMAAAQALGPGRAPAAPPPQAAPEGLGDELAGPSPTAAETLAPLDVEAQLGGTGLGDEVEAVAAPTARAPSEAWTADPDAGEGVPFAFLGDDPATAAGYLVEQNGKIDAFTAAGEQVGSFDGPDEAALALEDAIGVQTPAGPAQGFGDELSELGGAPVPKEAAVQEVVGTPFAPQTSFEYPTAPTADQALTPPAEPKSTEIAPDLHPGDAGSAKVPQAPRVSPAAVEPQAAPPLAPSEAPPEIPEPHGPTERRSGARAAKRRVAEMTPEQLREELLTHELTGIPNRRAYDESEKLPSQTAVDVDSLKWVNDNMGHDSGNELLRAVGEAIRAETDQAYHLSGDEFAIQSASDEEAAAIMERVEQRLAGATISVTMPDGNVVTLTGLGVSYGSGPDLSAADARLQSHKTEREAGGQRAARGVAPPGASRVAQETGRQDLEGDAAPAPATDQDRGGRAPGPTTAEDVTLTGTGFVSATRDVENVDLGEDVELGEQPTRPRPRPGSTQAREVAVRKLLGNAKNAPNYRFVRGNALPASVVGRMKLTPGHEWYGAFDPTSNRVYLNEDAIETEAEAAWYAMHEIAGHYGLRGAIGQLGASDRTKLDSALNLAAQNPYIAGLAAAIREQRTVSRLQSIEEALSELAAGVRTGNFERLANKYGVDVPEAFAGRDTKKPAWLRALDRFIDWLENLLFKATGQHYSDEQVRELIEGAWRYVQTGEAQPTAARRETATTAKPGLGDDLELTEEQQQTPAFKKWFGDSEVVDAKGKPLRMYHATQADVDAFRPWSHFGSARAANDRGRSVRMYDEVVGRTERVGASRTMPVYLSIQNALRMRDMAAQEIEDDSETAQREIYARQWEDPNDVAESLLEMGEISIDEFEEVRGSHDKIATVLQSKGYDGIVYENQVEGVDREDGVGDDSYIVFKPEQVKSAVGNTGAFDAGAPDIVAEPRERAGAEGPRRQARPTRSPPREEPEQLEAFTKDDARPGTNAKQLELSNELLREWAETAREGSPKIKTLATAFNRDFKADHTASLLGRNLKDPHEFALLAQTFRDPRYETLRYFFIDAAGKVIAETAVSSRLPGSSSAWPTGAADDWLLSMLKRVKGHGIRLLHNHPSGISQWSESDIAITSKIARVVGVPIEHVIIDSNEYSVIKTDDKGHIELGSQARVKLTELPKDTLHKPRGKRSLRPLMGVPIKSPRDMYRIAQQIKAPANKVSLIGLSMRHDVRAIGELRLLPHGAGVKLGARERRRDQLEEALKAFAIQNGAGRIVIAGVAPEVWDEGRYAYIGLVNDGFLLDVIDTNGRSLAEQTGAGTSFREFGVPGGVGTEVGSAKPIGIGGKQKAEPAERRKQPAPRSTAQRELDLEAAQRDLEELVDPKVTETSAFRRWFGKSKVVDEQGKPLVVYHGTKVATDFQAFKETGDIGFHFGTPKAAADRLGIDAKGEYKPKWSEARHGRVIPAYLSIKNPIRLPDLYEWPAAELVDELYKLDVVTKRQGDQIVAEHEAAPGDMAHLSADLVRKLLEAKGYDGIVYRNEAEGLERVPFEFSIEDVVIRKEPKLAHPWVAYRPTGERLTAASTEAHVREYVKTIFEEGDIRETDSWVALRPSQIKSAIGNRGTFDPEREEIHLAEEPKDERQAAGTPKSHRGKGGPGARYVSMYRSKGAPQRAQPATTMGAGARATVMDLPDEPIRAKHVIDLFQQLFKVKIYEGRPFKMRNALGFFRPSNFEVRNKNRNDLEVAAHEVFHWIDRTYPGIRKLYHQRRYADELKGVSYDKTQLIEGFAEFGRLFMTQEVEAITRTPTFYEAFVKEARDAGILDRLERVQRLMHQWYLQGAESRARSKIGTEKAPLRQRIEQMADGFVDRAIASSLDQLQAAKVIERETRGEIAADAAMSPYKSMRLLAGVRSTINAWLNYGTLKWSERGDLEFNGLGVRQIFEPVASVMDETLGLFVALRANELRKYGKENLFTKDEADALIERARKTGKIEAMQHAHEQYQLFTKRLLSFAVQSGILDPKTKAVWEQLYANYVPFYRVAEKFGSLDPRMAGGTRGGLFRRLTGGTANVADVFENITLNTALIVHASMRNVAKRQLFAAIESSPVGQRYAVRIPTSTEVRKVSMEQIERVLKDFAREAAEQGKTGVMDKVEAAELAQLAAMLANRSNDLGQATMSDVQDQAAFFFTGKPPTIPDKEQVLVNGKARWYQIGDPMLWDMLTTINYHQPLTLTEQVFGMAKRALTRGVTVTPEFQLANITRDTFNAFALSKGGQLPIIDAMKALRDIWTESPAFQEFLANGGGFGNATGDEAKRLRVRMKATGTRRLIAMPAELIDYWDKWGQSFELATRLAEYKKIRERGGTRREAAFQGREVSTDFAMRGHSALARWASISVSFFNARLQGLYRIERELNEKRGRQTVLRGERAIAYAMRGFMGLTTPALLVYWFLNRGDDDYEDLGEEIKSLNTVIPGPDGTQLLIPRPFETGAIFQEIPIRLLEYYRERDGDKLVDAMIFMLANTFNFNPTPQLVAPPLTIMRNRQWNGLPVVPRNLENVEPREQFQPWTPDTYKRVGEKLNVSPVKLQALVEGYFGTVGGYLVAGSDALMQAPDTSGAEPTRQLSQYPLVRRFMREQPYRNTSFEQEFYDLALEVTTVVDTARKMRREARVDDLEDYLGENEKAALFAIADVTEDVRQTAADLNAQMRALRQDAELSADEKLEQINELQAEQNALFRDAMQAFDEALLEELARDLGGL